MDDVDFGDAVTRSNVEWYVDTTLIEVAPNVLPEIGELERRAGGIGKALTFRIAIAAEIQQQMTDGIRGVDAIVQNRGPIGVALDGLVLAKRFEEIGERLAKDVFGESRLA